MRVAVFTDNDFDKVNGVTTTLNALLAHAPPDVAPRIYTASTLGADTPEYLALPSQPVPIPFYSEMDVYVPRSGAYLRQVLADGIDVLHLTTPGPIGLTALWIAAKTGLPLIGSFHTDLATYTSLLSGSKLLGRLMNRYLRWIYGRCAHTLVPSCATRELMLGDGAPAERISLWTRGVDTRHFTPERRSSRLRRQWRATDREPVLLYVGRVSREKGLEALPEMLYRLRAIGVRHRMVVAGDGPLRPWLMQQMPEATFMGSLGRQEVADVFASADLFVFPSTTDTAGNVVLEAQASGLPVIVSDAGGPRENMVPDETGLICHGTDAKHWAAVVAGVLQRPAMRVAMGHAARQYALGRKWELALASVYQAYRDAMRRIPQGAPVHHAA